MIQTISDHTSLSPNNVLRHIGSRLEVFIDHYLIESMRDTRLLMHQPQPAGTALHFDAPWEGRFPSYGTVLHDEGRYHLYYRGKPDVGIDGAEDEVTCYATSGDGVNWERPAFTMFAAGGATSNNVILDRSWAPGNFSPFIDANPAAPAEERFKGVAGLDPDGLFAYASADGIHWRRLGEGPIMQASVFAFDSQNVPFWSAHEGCYVLYFRTWIPHPNGEGEMGFRSISRTTSPDFIHWTHPVPMEFGGAPLEHLYTNQTTPYFRAMHIYIGLAARFWPGKGVISAHDADELGVLPLYRNDCSDTVLLTSRGGNVYDRTFLESFIRPGIGPGNWVSRSNYAAVGIVPTGPAEISMYVCRSYTQPLPRLERLTLRTDGFASVQAPYTGGEMRTHPLTFTGRELHLNCACSAAGSVVVELQDSDGRPIPGFTEAEAIPTLGDALAHVVQWKNGPDLGKLAGKPVRLRFIMRDADLYAMQFTG